MSLTLLVILLFPASGIFARQSQAKKAGRAPTPAADPAREAKEKEKHQKALGKLEEDVRYAATTERIKAISHLTSLKAEEKGPFYTILTEIYPAMDDAGVRKTILSTLSTMMVPEKGKTLELERVSRSDREKTLKVIVSGLSDEDEFVQREAISAIVRLDAREKAVDIFENVVKTGKYDEDQNFNLSGGINALATLRYSAASTFLIEKLKFPELQGDIKRSILLYFGRSGAANSIDVLISHLKDTNQDILSREYAANSLGRLRDKKALPSLQETLKEIRAIRDMREKARFSRLKLQTVTALVSLGNNDVKKDLIATASDDNPGLRYRAIQYLGDLKIMEAKKLIEYKAKHDPDSRVKKVAKESLEKLNGTFAGDDDENAADKPVER